MWWRRLRDTFLAGFWSAYESALRERRSRDERDAARRYVELRDQIIAANVKRAEREFAAQLISEEELQRVLNKYGLRDQRVNRRVH
jgi:hypothetical protein